MSELTPEREAELRKCISERIGLSTPEVVELFAALDAARRERDAWRSATGLASLTPEQAGERIDAMDDRLADADVFAKFTASMAAAPDELHNAAESWLARAAAWREGKVNHAD